MSTPPTIEQLQKELYWLSTQVENQSEAIRLFCDAIDAATTQLRRNLGTAPQEFKRADEQTPSKPQYDLNKIAWSESKGNKGPFLLATVRDQLTDENKSNFNALRDELTKNAGKGIYTKARQIWLMGDGQAIGCRNKEQKQ